MRRFAVAIAQITPVLGDVERNLALHEKAVEEAVTRGAGLLVFPELSLTGYFVKDQVPSIAIGPRHPVLERLLGLSRRLALVVGAVEESADARFYNTALYLEGGEVRHVHRKVYLPTYGIFDEQRYLAAGDRIRAFDTALGRMAILICEDAWHPSAASLAAQDGAEVLLIPSCSPGIGLSQEGQFANARYWETILRAYAGLFTTFVVYAHRVGYEDGACFWGGSEIVTPTGERIAKARYLEEDFLVAELDPTEIRRARTMNPLLRDERLDLTLRELQRIVRTREAGDAR